MRVYTRRECMKDAINSWLNTYSRYPTDKPMEWTKGVNLGVIMDKVSALDPEKCTPDEMKDALGIAWSANTCDECNMDSEALMRFGDEPDYDARWQDLCSGCLCKALDDLP